MFRPGSAERSIGRFKDGADSWVRQMWKVARDQFGPSLTAEFDTTVTKLYPSPQGPTVVWEDAQKNLCPPAPFDMVVSTLDMFTNALILNQPENQLWAEVYEPRVGTAKPDGIETTVWPLQPGYCALHQDTSILAEHDGTQRLETLQFNGKVGAIDGGSGFDLSKTFSTYIESNLMGIHVERPEDDFCLTMYGYDPGGDAPKHQVWSSRWNHGMWLPSFMVDEKLASHRAKASVPTTAFTGASARPGSSSPETTSRWTPRRALWSRAWRSQNTRSAQNRWMRCNHQPGVTTPPSSSLGRSSTCCTDS